MDTNNLFEKASRLKLRFNYRGMISVEDLWDMSLESLDAMYKSLNSLVKESKEESLLNTRTSYDEELTLKAELLKYIVKTKMEENEAKLKAREKKAQKQKLLEVMSAKQDEALQGKSLEELAKMIDELG